MPTREEMRSLGHEIIGSYETRAAGIATLREEVTIQRQAAQAELHELHRAHQAMARKLRADLGKVHPALSKTEARRKSEVKAWVKEVAATHAGGRDEWRKLTVTMQAKRGGAGQVEAAGG